MCSNITLGSATNKEQWICSNCAGRITVNGSAVKSGRILKEHDYIGVNLGVRQEPRENQTPKVMYEYKHSRIFNKAAPIPVYPSRRFFKNSMTEILKVPASSRGLCSDWMRLRQVI